MSTASKGSTVKVHYTGKLTDDTVFDSSREREPLEFTVGSGQLIEGFDTAVDGMAVGESKQITIPSDKAYGPRRDEAMITVEKTQLPDEVDPQVGMQLQASNDQGQSQILTIAEVRDADVVLDGNHPLAGKDLVFDIELLEISE